MRVAHDTVWGSHRNEKTTHKELVATHFWPGLEQDVKKYVSQCEWCQLAKGVKPSRQGFLSGWHHNKVLNQVCMDLVGPISLGTTGHVKHVTPTYILVITDPFSHMVWLECIAGKSAEEVFDKFVERFLLEEGCCPVILTDQGREFDNKMLKGLMELLRTRLKFTPSYHPRGNYTERVNRLIGESLRTMINMPGAKKQDWHKLVKFIQFAYRRMHIPGTNLSPYMVARGRQPRIPSKMPLVDTNEAILPGPALDEHVAEVKKNLELAEKMLIAARREVLEKSKERFDQTQIEEKFEPGEHVRYFNRLIVRRDDAAEVSTKLKLRNTRYVVVRRLSYSRYLIKHLYTGREKDAHVTQIARMRLDEATAPELPEAAVEPVVEVDALWKKVKPGKFVVFWVRTNSKAHLTLMEVVNVNDNDQELFGWYYCHRVPCARYLYERPLVQIRFAPE